MTFPLGKPILVMLALALISGIGMVFRPSPPRADMVMWSFVEDHIESYRGRADVPGEPPGAKYTRVTKKTVEFDWVSGRAEDVWLVSMFTSHTTGQIVPDAVEIEIGSIGKYFRPPNDEVGFYPLNDFLKSSGWYDKIVQSRFAPYSKNGVIYGVPHDVHPTTISYRKDLFDQAGVDLASAKTWEQFRDLCLKFQSYWKQQGHPRAAIGLSRTAADLATINLQQRHINIIDDQNRVFINDPKVVQTIRFNAELVAGPNAISKEFNPAPNAEYPDLAGGEICAMITPDWRAGFMKEHIPEAAGKIAMMPLPIFDPGDAPTASWGGTMIGIPRNCKDPAASWKLIEMLYLDHDAIDYRRKTNGILPPIKAYWSDPIYQQRDPFYAGNQKANQLFISLANQLPTLYTSQFTAIAQGMLSDVLGKTVSRIDDAETDHLDQDIQSWLDDSAKDLQRRILFGTFKD